MTRKYKNDTTVFNWFFDLGTAELKCQELTVYSWEYMDGMQWHVVDEYQLLQEYYIPFFKFFKKKKTNIIRRPGYLISSDKNYAKMMLVAEMVKGFGYILERDLEYTCSDGTRKAIITAQKEYEIMSEEYPELVVKSFGEFRPDESNSGWLWASYGNV